MLSFYKKDQVLFSVACILVYVVGCSITDQVSLSLGMDKCVTIAFQLALIGVLVAFVAKNGLLGRYGFQAPQTSAGKMLWYVPLAILASVNLWFGCAFQYAPLQTCVYVASMLAAGFLEELIFRGFLFRAMAQGNITAAVAVSSLTFGIGHIVNLVNGSGAELIPNLCQVVYAAAIGLALVEVFYRSGSIVPCMLTHGILNALSAFCNDAAFTPEVEIGVSAALTVVAVGYALWLIKKVPEPHLLQE